MIEITIDVPLRFSTLDPVDAPRILEWLEWVADSRLWSAASPEPQRPTVPELSELEANGLIRAQGKQWSVLPLGGAVVARYGGDLARPLLTVKYF